MLVVVGGVVCVWRVGAGGIPGVKEVPGFEISSPFELFHQTHELEVSHLHTSGIVSNCWALRPLLFLSETLAFATGMLGISVMLGIMAAVCGCWISWSIAPNLVR